MDISIERHRRKGVSVSDSGGEIYRIRKLTSKNLETLLVKECYDLEKIEIAESRGLSGQDDGLN